MTAILGRLWVGCQSQVVVVNTSTLEIEVRWLINTNLVLPEIGFILLSV